MLLIYDYLVEKLQKHLNERNINAKIKSCIGRSWHCYRFIQVLPVNVVSGVHYEYTNNHWEIHFENHGNNAEVEEWRRIFMSKINSDGVLNWHRKNGYQREYLSIEEEVEEHTFLSIFDKLWDLTSGYFNTRGSHVEETSAIDIEKEVDTTQTVETLILCDDSKYKEPEIRLSTVGELPFEQFVIPPYQRPYKWSAKNVNQLINDIITFCEKGNNEYRLGTLVLHKQETNLYIVDGQQRSITLILILSELAKKADFQDLFKDIAIEQFLKKPQFHEYTSRMHIRENINAVRFRLSEFKKEHVLFLLNKCKFVIVTLYDISEAFQFFDSQNARGKELDPHDLLKAYHLREIPQMTDVDRSNIRDWENLGSSRLSNLFLVLFRIKRWIDGNEGRFFTSNKVDTFKGPKITKVLLPYQKIYAMAECYADEYNRDTARRLDCQHMDFPHQIDQIIINGTLFFDMVRYYSQREVIVKEMVQKHCPRIDEAIKTYAERNRKGDIYTRNLFYAALLFYYDKFSDDGLGLAVPKIFAWAYSMRIKHNTVQLATMDNKAREHNSFFRILHRAIAPSDIQNWIVNPIKEDENMQKGKMVEIINVLKEYNYIA